MRAARLFPCLQWLRKYRRAYFLRDFIAAVIVTVMLIPQSLAYAILAGLPPQVGLYASILPLVLYAIFGTSSTLSVGPVAVTSLMTASAIASVSAQGAVDPVQAAIILAFISGVLLVVLGLLRFGFLANFLSHPVVSGFISASGLLIALSQLKHILGIAAEGDNLPELLHSLAQNLPAANTQALLVGGSAMLFLFWARKHMKKLMCTLGMNAYAADLCSKGAPVLAVIVTTLVAHAMQLEQAGLALVGTVPAGLPALQLPALDGELWLRLLVPAVLISIIGYVESVSVGKTLGARRRQKIDVDQELVGLGAANIAASVSGGFPVTGGFSRSVVNFDAGAETQAASFLTALGIALSALFLADLLAYLPRTTLAATIIVAVLGLVDFSILKKTWRFSKSDFAAVFATLIITLLVGVEMGVLSGVVSSIALHLFKTTRPHIAEVGQIDGTEHFRNVKRHKVMTHPAILTLRMDESIYFANASFLENEIFRNLAEKDQIRHVILMCTAVNEIDISAVEVLESINDTLKDLDIGFHLSEVKGPVMDCLQKTDFLDHLNGYVFLSQHMAFAQLSEREDKSFGSDYHMYDI